MTASTRSVSRPVGDIVKAGLIAAVSAAVVNALVFLLGRALGSFPDTALTPAGRPIDAPGAALLSVVGVIAGSVLYTVLTRRFETDKANRWFRIIAVIVLVAMIPTPLGIAGAPVSQIVLLEVMHLVAGLASIYFLTMWGQSSGR
jgi:hypothetical protein